jgi:hypothetical protein
VPTAGLTKFRLHITALTASCTIAMAGSATPSTQYLMNPNSAPTGPLSVVDSTGLNALAIDVNGIASVKVTNGTQSMPTGDAAARTIFVKPNDGTNAITVKAASTAAAATDTALVVTTRPGDLCQSPNIAKSSAVLNQSSSATTKVVDTSSSTVIYVCGFVATTVGTSPTVTFITGTHGSADCDTSAANLTGAMVGANAGGVLSSSGPGVLFKSIAGGQICMTTGATTSIQGVLTYVQQ